MRRPEGPSAEEPEDPEQAIHMVVKGFGRGLRVYKVPPGGS